MVNTQKLKLMDIVKCEYYKEFLDKKFTPIIGKVLGYEVGYNGHSQQYVTIESIKTGNKYKIESTLLELIKT